MQPLRSGSCVRCSDIPDSRDYGSIVDVMCHATGNSKRYILNWFEFMTFNQNMVIEDVQQGADHTQWFIGITPDGWVAFFTSDPNSIKARDSQELMGECLKNLDIRDVSEFRALREGITGPTLLE